MPIAAAGAFESRDYVWKGIEREKDGTRLRLSDYLLFFSVISVKIDLLLRVFTCNTTRYAISSSQIYPNLLFSNPSSAKVHVIFKPVVIYLSFLNP